MSEWYLLRTRSGQERKVRDRLTLELPELFLPLLKVRVRRWEKPVETIVPLFPCYLFSLFDPQSQYRRVRYTPGVRELVSAGGEFVTVPPSTIENLKRRCADGPIEIPRAALRSGDPVRIVKGPLCGLEATFDTCLSGTERVRILLSCVNNNVPRVTLPASSITLIT
jgi:transcriptional antiterminator RfaH